MSGATKQPTPQAISRLLAKAGFVRSNHGRPGVSYQEVTTGFVAWKTYHQSHPEQPYVAVQHDVEGMFSRGLTNEDWNAYLAEARARLEDYAEVIREAGFAAMVRNRGDEPPWLTILTIVPGAGST